MGGDSASARRTRLAFIQEQTARRKTQAAGSNGATADLHNQIPTSNGKPSQLAPRFQFPSMTTSSKPTYDAFSPSFSDSPSPSPPSVTPKPRPISISSISSISSSSSSNSSSSPSSPSSSATSVTCTPASIAPAHSRSLSLSSSTSHPSSPLSKPLLSTSRSSSSSSLSSQPLSNGAAAAGAPILNINSTIPANATSTPDVGRGADTDVLSASNASISSFDRQQYFQFMNETSNQSATRSNSLKFPVFNAGQQSHPHSQHSLPHGRSHINSSSFVPTFGGVNGNAKFEQTPSVHVPSTRTRRVTLPTSTVLPQQTSAPSATNQRITRPVASSNLREQSPRNGLKKMEKVSEEEPFLFYSSDGRVPKGFEHLSPPRQNQGPGRGQRGVRQIQEGFRFPPVPPTSYGAGGNADSLHQQQPMPKPDFELIYEAVPKSQGPMQQPAPQAQARHDHYGQLQQLQQQRQRPQLGQGPTQGYPPSAAPAPSFLPFPSYQSSNTYTPPQSSQPWPAQVATHQNQQYPWPVQSIAPQYPPPGVNGVSSSPAPGPGSAIPYNTHTFRQSPLQRADQGPSTNANEQTSRNDAYMLQKGFKYPSKLGPGLEMKSPPSSSPDLVVNKSDNVTQNASTGTKSSASVSPAHSTSTAAANPSPLIQRLQQRTARVLQQQVAKPASNDAVGATQTDSPLTPRTAPAVQSSDGSRVAGPGPVGMRKYTHARSISSPSLLSTLGMSRIGLGGSNGNGNSVSGLGKGAGNGPGTGSGGIIGSGVGVGGINGAGGNGTMNVVGNGTGTVRKKTHRKSASSLDSILEEEWE